LATSQRFTELQEGRGMTETSEAGIKSEHGEGERNRESGAQTSDAERHAISDNHERLQFLTASLSSGSVQHSYGIGVPAGKSSVALRLRIWWDELRMQQIAGTAAALLFAGLAPASVMAALWHAAKIAGTVFAFTLAIALSHAVLLGLPLFLVFRSKGWINVMACAIFGFAVGAVPAGLLTWPTQHPGLHAAVPDDGVLTVIKGAATAAGWISYVTPLIYFGSLGALGGLAFWIVLTWSGSFGKDAE
jgi:hypothetical protein